MQSRSRRFPQGERGLKYILVAHAEEYAGRSPQGERGLKSEQPARLAGAADVVPRKGNVD